MSVFEIAGGIALVVVALLNWRYVLVFAALLLGLWLCLDKPYLALIIAAIAIPGVLLTSRAARGEQARAREDAQLQAWQAVRTASEREHRVASVGLAPASDARTIADSIENERRYRNGTAPRRAAS